MEMEMELSHLNNHLPHSLFHMRKVFADLNYCCSTSDHIQHQQQQIKSNSSSSSSNGGRQSAINVTLAFENPTYVSEEDLLRTNASSTAVIQREGTIVKKTIKSIKRKDKLRKFQPFSGDRSGGGGGGFRKLSNNDDECDEQEEEEEAAESNENDDLVDVSSRSLSRYKSMPADLNADEEGDEEEEEQEEEQEELRRLEMQTNMDYERNLKKKFRNQAISRSLRKAKYIYYRNMKSKSLEDLNAEERINYLQKTVAKLARNFESNFSTSCSNLFNADAAAAVDGGCLNKNNNKNNNNNSSRRSSAASLASSAAVSIGHMSDFGSIFLHELSDWSPEIDSSDSYTSDEENERDGVCFEFSDFNSSYMENEYENERDDEDDEEEEDEENDEADEELINGIKEVTTVANPVEILLQPPPPPPPPPPEFVQTMPMPTNIPSTSSEFLKHLKLTKYLSDEDGAATSYLHKDKCLICLTKFVPNEEVAAISCKHAFHFTCISVWLANKASKCPICFKSCLKINQDETEQKKDDEQQKSTTPAAASSFNFKRETLL